MLNERLVVIVSSERYLELISAGAPELPGDWFYEIRAGGVSDTDFYCPDLMLRIARPGRWFGTRGVTYWVEAHPGTLGNLVLAAERCWNDVKDVSERSEARDKWVGRHP